MPNINIKYINEKEKQKLSERTNITSKPQSDDNLKDWEEYMFFSIQDTIFALPSIYTTEVITTFSIESFLFFPDFIKGIVNIRGTILPVNDLSLLIFGIPSGNNIELIKIKYENIETTIAVNLVQYVELINKFEIHQEDKLYKYTNNIIKFNKNIAYLFDIKEFFNDKKIIVNQSI